MQLLERGTFQVQGEMQEEEEEGDPEQFLRPSSCWFPLVPLFFFSGARSILHPQDRLS